MKIAQRLKRKANGAPRRKRFLACLLAGFIVLSGGGLAFAYWTISGSGSGHATTSAPSAVTVVQTTAVSGMYPGDTIALAGDFNNPNSGKVYITAVTAVIGSFSTTAAFPSDPACTQTSFTITGTSNTPGEINAGSGVGSWSGLSITMNDLSTNQNNCESLTAVPIVYTSS